MKIDDNDLRHLSYGLELENLEDDLPNSIIMPDDHGLVSEGKDIEKDLPYRSAIELVLATPAKKPMKHSNTNQHRNTTAARKLAIATALAFSHPEPAPS